jgi:hypothetical protein
LSTTREARLDGFVVIAQTSDSTDHCTGVGVGACAFTGSLQPLTTFAPNNISDAIFGYCVTKFSLRVSVISLNELALSA